MYFFQGPHHSRCLFGLWCGRLSLTGLASPSSSSSPLYFCFLPWALFVFELLSTFTLPLSLFVYFCFDPFLVFRFFLSSTFARYAGWPKLKRLPCIKYIVFARVLYLPRYQEVIASRAGRHVSFVSQLWVLARCPYSCFSLAQLLISGR